MLGEVAADEAEEGADVRDEGGGRGDWSCGGTVEMAGELGAEQAAMGFGEEEC